MDRLEFWGRLSFLKGGIRDADVLTTVSPTYAEEIQTPEFGFGFDGVLRGRRGDLAGILNGIDTTEWDPARDERLPKPYDIHDLSGKTVAKADVLARYYLPTDEAAMARPLIGMISRMVDQKGFDLIAGLTDTLPTLDATFVVLGTGEASYQDMWTNLAAEHTSRVGARIGFDEAMAHLIEAGADIFLIPSRFEPCGLNQMYSLRYGTVPVVHGVGGLFDTVADAGPATAKPGRGAAGVAKATGFVFGAYTPAALLEAVTRALAAFGDRAAWRTLQQAGIQQDFSWDRSAQEYVKIYDRAIIKRLET